MKEMPGKITFSGTPTEAEVILIATHVRLDSQPFHPVCKMALRIFWALRDHEKRKPGYGKGVNGRDRHSVLECMETVFQTRALSAADRKNSQNPRKGSSGHLNFTNLRQGKIKCP